MTAAKKRVSMTPNQLVALNITAQRKTKGWTQRETCDRLEPLLGQRWSPAVLSAAERSALGHQRRREFTADELVALARLFNVPIGALLDVPPETDFEVPDKRRGLAEADVAAVVGIDRAEVHRQARELARGAQRAAMHAAEAFIISIPTPKALETEADREERLEAEAAIAAIAARQEDTK